MGLSADAILKKIPGGLGNVIGGAVKSKKFWATAISSIALSFVLPKMAISVIAVWLVVQTGIDVTKVLTGEAGTLPVTLAERFQHGFLNVIGGLLGSKKALVTGGVATTIAYRHPAWAAGLVCLWIVCQGAVDVALIVKKRK